MKEPFLSSLFSYSQKEKINIKSIKNVRASAQRRVGFQWFGKLVPVLVCGGKQITMNATSHIQKMAIMLSTLLSINLAAQQTTPDVTATPENNSFAGYDYKNGVGVRMGVTSGLTYKHKFNQSNAFEAIVNAWPYTLGVTALYERYKSTDVPGLNCYFGGGAHANIGGPYRRVYYYRYYDNRRYTYMYVSDGRAIGIDGIIGLEYKFKPIPLAISADIKPFTEVNNYGNFYIALDPSIGLKLTF